MKYLLIVALTIVLSFLALMNSGHCRHSLRKLTGVVLHREYLPAADTTFTSRQITGIGPGPRESRFGSTPYVNSDCVDLISGSYRFPSSGDAEAQFHEWVRSASKVVSITDQTIPPAAERAVMQIAGDRDFTIVFKDINSKHIYSISSPSLNHALLFEKQNKWEKIPE